MNLSLHAIPSRIKLSGTTVSGAFEFAGLDNKPFIHWAPINASWEVLIKLVEKEYNVSLTANPTLKTLIKLQQEAIEYVCSNHKKLFNILRHYSQMECGTWLLKVTSESYSDTCISQWSKGLQAWTILRPEHVTTEDYQHIYATEAHYLHER